MVSLITLLFCLTLQQTYSRNFYVSNEGHDHDGCGKSQGNMACGSLYYISNIIQNMSSQTNQNQSALIYVYSQNETTILQNMRQQLAAREHELYHPCVPIPMKNINNLTIIFYNTESNKWLPDICSQIHNISFINEYMFDVSANYLFISGLNIFDHASEAMQFGFIRNDRYEGLTICDHCIFMNIYSILDYPLIRILSSLQLSYNNFINITSGNDLIFIHNIIGEFLLYNSKFQNIWTETTIITYNYPFPSKKTTIFSTSFIQILSGSILKTSTVAGSDYVPDIVIQNVNISTSQLYIDNMAGLFNFDRGHITFQNIIFYYDYDIFANCHKKYTDVIINMSYMYVSCVANTPFIINNYAQVTLKSVYFGHSITTELFNQYKKNIAPDYDYMYMNYELQNHDWQLWQIYSPVIWNRFIMHIVDFYVNGYVVGAGTFISNEHVLNVDNFQIISDHFNPNSLGAWTIIQHNSHLTGILKVYNSYFIGAEYQIHTTYGSVEISNCTFENATEAHQIWYSNNVLIKSNSYNRIGRYYAGFRAAFVEDYINNWPASVAVFSKNIVMENNKFNCWDPDGLIIFYQCTNILLVKNTLNVDASELFYSIPQWMKVYDGPGFAVVSMIESANSSIISNNFESNPIDPFGTPWIKYSGNINFDKLDSTHGNNEQYGPLSCLSGNNFTNYAIATADTNITSCFRRDLIQCLLHDIYCMDGTYGTMNDDLLDVNSVFNVNLDVDVFRVLTNNSFIALDNLYIRNNINENKYALEINTG
eukprot:26282_1